MARHTAIERERDYQKDQAGYFHQLKQTFSDPEFQAAWKRLVELLAEEQLAFQRCHEIDNEISTSPQNKTRADNDLLKDPVWGRKLRRSQEFAKEYFDKRDAYDEAMGALRKRFKVSLLLGPREGETLTNLQTCDFARFLSSPGILDDQEPVQIIFPHPPRRGVDLDFSPTLFSGDQLLLAVNMNHPLQALRAAFDGVLQFVMSELPDRRARRVHQQPETFRSKVMALAAQGLKRKEITVKLLPSEMASRDPKIRKNALQRVTDAQRPRRR